VGGRGGKKDALLEEGERKKRGGGNIPKTVFTDPVSSEK